MIFFGGGGGGVNFKECFRFFGFLLVSLKLSFGANI